jgi:hypothetical protein
MITVIGFTKGYISAYEQKCFMMILIFECMNVWLSLYILKMFKGLFYLTEICMKDFDDKKHEFTKKYFLNNKQECFIIILIFECMNVWLSLSIFIIFKDLVC